MRLLYVTDVCPWPATNGGLIRHARLIEQLARRNEMRIVVLDSPPSTATEVPPNAEFMPLCESIRSPGIPSSGWGQRTAVLKSLVNPLPEMFQPSHQPLVMRTIGQLREIASQCEVCWVPWPYLAAIAMDKWQHPRIVVDYMDISTLVQLSQFRLLRPGFHKFHMAVDTLKLAWHERQVARKAWRLAVCKASDGRFLRQPRKTFVVPNGTDSRPLLPPAEADPMRLLFVGLLRYRPNVDAAIWFIQDCLPLLKELPLQMDVVGRDPPEEVRKLSDGQRVRVHGFAPDLMEFYRRATVVVAPVRTGSGTKLKVLEALGFGKALIATTEAAAGLDIRPGIDYLRADTPTEMAEACRRLISDPELRARLGRAGRESVEKRYTWNLIGEMAHRAVCP